MHQEPAAADRAPRWAKPLLAAIIVAKRRPHYLRRLADSEFAALARACDKFVLWSTLPELVVAAPFLPSSVALVVVAGASIWGLAALGLVGAPIAAERMRRGRGPKKHGPKKQ
jgi:hypothetical protein